MQSVLNAFGDVWWYIAHILSLTDVLDILIITVLLYQLVILTKQTPAIQVLKGLVILIVVRYLSQWAQLYTVSWLTNAILSNTPLLIVYTDQWTETVGNCIQDYDAAAFCIIGD